MQTAQTVPRLPYSDLAIGGVFLAAAGGCAGAIAYLETRYAHSARPPGIMCAEVALGLLGGALGACGAAILRPEPDQRSLAPPAVNLAPQPVHVVLPLATNYPFEVAVAMHADGNGGAATPIPVPPAPPVSPTRSRVMQYAPAA